MPENNENRRRRPANGERRIDVVKFCAFWGIFLSALSFLISGICNIAGGSSTLITIFDIVAKVALLIGIGFPAYTYVAGKRRVWRIIFWVALVIYIVGCVFSFITIG